MEKEQVEELLKTMNQMAKEVREIFSLIVEAKKVVPDKEWYTLAEACELKNLSYKTAQNHRYLLPLKGQWDATIGGKHVWSRKTILEWVTQTDELLKEK